MTNQNKELEEDEINLRDYWQVIKKRKREIIAIFSSVIVIAMIIFLLTPKTYASSSLVKVGKIQIPYFQVSQPYFQLSQPFENIKTTTKIIKQSTNSSFEINEIEKDELIEIKGFGETSEKAKKAAEEITALVLARHQDLFNKYTQIQKQEIERLKARIKENENYLKMLNPKIPDYLKNLIELKGQQDELQKELALNQKELNLNFRESEIISQPVLSSSPFKPNIKLNILVAAIIGLFLSVFWAFLKEMV